MVSFKTALSTVKTTRNFWVTLSLRYSGAKKTIIFRNGYKQALNWDEYRIIRDVVSKGYSVEPYGDMLCFKKNNMKIVGPLPIIDVLIEDNDELYLTDYQDKVVLDVGGFIGDTAVLFAALGAKKVIIYEPVVAHHEIIKINLSLNAVNAEIHEEGIGETDGSKIIRYETTSTGFGLNNLGSKEMRIKIKSVTKVIEESGADVAKFDCEGAESSLINVPNEILRKISFYIIEVHNAEIKKSICEKFKKSGFDLVKDITNVTGKGMSTVTFRDIKYKRNLR